MRLCLYDLKPGKVVLNLRKGAAVPITLSDIFLD